MDKIKADLLQFIDIAGFPVGIDRPEADSSWVVVIDELGKATGYDYADGAIDKDPMNLSLVDLAWLVEHPIRGADLVELLERVH